LLLLLLLLLHACKQTRLPSWNHLLLLLLLGRLLTCKQTHRLLLGPTACKETQPSCCGRLLLLLLLLEVPFMTRVLQQRLELLQVAPQQHLQQPQQAHQQRSSHWRVHVLEALLLACISTAGWL
jgi:hypothetical protein